MPTLVFFINLIIFISCVNVMLLIYRLRLKNLVMGNRPFIPGKSGVVILYLYHIYISKKVDKTVWIDAITRSWI